ncbi:MAG: cytochrome c nitrite reductase small subunit [Anaerolineae bacterium]
MKSLLVSLWGGARGFVTAFPYWLWLLLILFVGGVVGLGSFTVVYAKGYSYLSDDPAACANCHVMREFYDGWNRSPHHAVATCNDCHTPHDLAGHYTVKALNGFRHSSAFTLGDIPDPIRIIPSDRAVTQQACLDCHGDLVAMISHPGSNQPTDCLSCHAGVGHGK